MGSFASLFGGEGTDNWEECITKVLYIFQCIPIFLPRSFFLKLLTPSSLDLYGQARTLEPEEACYSGVDHQADWAYQISNVIIGQQTCSGCCCGSPPHRAAGANSIGDIMSFLKLEKITFTFRGSSDKFYSHWQPLISYLDRIPAGDFSQ